MTKNSVTFKDKFHRFINRKRWTIVSKMKRYNPYLKMKFNPKTKELSMSKETFIMWLETWAMTADSHHEMFISVLDHFTRE